MDNSIPRNQADDDRQGNAFYHAETNVVARSRLISIVGVVVETSILEAIVRRLGGPSVLGKAIHSQAALASAIHQRLPLASLEFLLEAGFTSQEIADFVIPQRTRRHRSYKKQPLTIAESDRVVRLLHIQVLAEEAFGNVDKANRWLRQPLVELGHESPLAMVQTGVGARVIETILGKIAWGSAA